MSKAFTSEEPVEAPVLGRPVARAARGTERPMTPQGYRALVALQQRLLGLRGQSQDPEAKAQLDHRLALLSATLESVRVVEPPPCDGVIRFGSTVTLKWDDGRTQVVRLVGPDEVDGKGIELSVESPLARTLLEQRQGDDIEFERPRGVAVVTVVAVS
jgi:transcription elongation GreA/GreB family factor